MIKRSSGLRPVAAGRIGWAVQIGKEGFVGLGEAVAVGQHTNGFAGLAGELTGNEVAPAQNAPLPAAKMSRFMDSDAGFSA